MGLEFSLPDFQTFKYVLKGIFLLARIICEWILLRNCEGLHIEYVKKVYEYIHTAISCPVV